MTQGFANRAAQQQETLRSTLLDPNSTPQQRKSAQEALMTLSGKQSADPYLVVPGGQHVDPQSGKAYNTPSTVFNRQTGQFVQQPGAGGAEPPANHVAWLKQNPGQAANFDQIYGAGASKRVLNGG